MNGVNEELASADKRFLLHALEKEREEKSKGVEMSFFFPQHGNRGNHAH